MSLKYCASITYAIEKYVTVILNGTLSEIINQVVQSLWYCNVKEKTLHSVGHIGKLIRPFVRSHAQQWQCWFNCLAHLTDGRYEQADWHNPCVHKSHQTRQNVPPSDAEAHVVIQQPQPTWGCGKWRSSGTRSSHLFLPASRRFQSYAVGWVSVNTSSIWWRWFWSSCTSFCLIFVGFVW